MQRLQEIFLGEIGGSINDFYDMSLDELISAITGCKKRQDEEMKAHYEMLRLLGMWVLAPHTTKVKNVRDVVNYPWDLPTAKDVQLSADKIKEIRERVLARDRKEIIKIEKDAWQR